jgi:hypothetical protein
MKVSITYGVMGLSILLLMLGFAWGEKTLFTKHFQNTLFDVTEHTMYSVEILLDDQEYKIGKNVIGIVIHNAHDEDVMGAEITFVLKDLVADKNFPVTSKITDKGNGLYIVSGLDLQKEGKWELTITVKKDHIEDFVKFVLPDALKARVPRGKYSP